MKRHIWGDVALSAFFTALSIVMYTEALSLPEGLFGTLGPGYFPKIILVCLMFASGSLTIRLCITALRSTKEGSSATQGDGPSFVTRYRFVAVILAAFFLYVIGMKWVGFLPSTLAFTAVTMWLLAPPDKSWTTLRTIASISIVLSLGLYVFFTYGVSVMLPPGTLWR